THSFTTPFFVYSTPDPDRVVTDIWRERWRLPFRIHPLGDPTRQVNMDDAKKAWPILQASKSPSVSAALNITGTTVFVPSEISSEDWSLIITSLSIAA